MKPRVYAAIDVDGVVLDLVDYITRRLQINPDLWKTWEFEKSYTDPAHSKEFERLIKLSPDMFVYARPYQDAQRGILKLLDADIDFCFMSSFPPEFVKLREWWLWYNLMCPQYSQYHRGRFRVRLMCVEADYKANVCRTQGITHILEDNPKTAIDCVTKGIKAYLVPRIYNEGLFEPHVPHATLDEFADIIIKETAEYKASI